MKQIRWGMIGCGDVTEVKSGPGFYKAENSTLVAVMRRNGALAADYARRHGVPRWHDDADAIIHATDIDAVYIATAYRQSLRVHAALRGRGQARIRREADGDDQFAVRGDDRCMSRRRRAVVGRLLSPGAAALPEGA
jgi:hypothetical protein